jgi:Mycothiol maleylpyruvate isomerase N-terminal domain
MTADRYRRLAARFTELVDAVPADRWDAPLLWAEWSAHDVFDHVVSTEIDHWAECRLGSSLPPTSSICGPSGR